jgi:Flp pilus assembly protein TadG
MKPLIKSALQRCRTAVARGSCAGREEAGSTLIEFALCAVVLFTIMFGIMAFSMVMYCSLMTSQAARQAARYASVRGNSWTTDCTAPGSANCIAQKDDIQALAQKVVAVNSKNLKVDTTWLSSSGVACGTADSCKAPGNLVKVTATYSYSAIFPLVPTQSYSMSSTAQMVIAQ